MPAPNRVAAGSAKAGSATVASAVAGSATAGSAAAGSDAGVPRTAGSVTLVGGGPGAVELMTVAAVAALKRADVVLFDRLAPNKDLASLAPFATLIDVGKRAGSHPVSQSGIEDLLVEHALAGQRVVRLKGGDPYIFGRGSEEVLACHRSGVAVTVISGVTSAIAVPAEAGIPLTHRGMSHSFTVISGHAPLTENELAGLTLLESTIVVLMGVGTLPTLTQGLLRHGVPADLPVAIIERGFSAAQRTTVSTLSAVLVDAAVAGVASPAVLVIGKVVRLAFSGDAAAEDLVARAAEYTVAA
ncbi:MAG: uroporphyrinogen-III C-methyltransferase [Cryobacterium sp.]|uniref:uroporphyrinogen-III C-methyltransferase n=1 Tax=unclassified Cryobacterium TaxID=2649013 RepID=UPI0018CB8C9C|nr:MULTISPECIES: uroporphyrinogen-III C-methyltransferase [unclassified Cryobacterium]MCY7405320.1 uroporphyrinogen-III C-methyltransferase [Cryobacterium sp.]MEC5152865.1 uroporphyrin-III C-methyltransferase [Cryobacterium sp. CAN_C3]